MTTFSIAASIQSLNKASQYRQRKAAKKLEESSKSPADNTTSRAQHPMLGSLTNIADAASSLTEQPTSSPTLPAESTATHSETVHSFTPVCDCRKPFEEHEVNKPLRFARTGQGIPLKPMKQKLPSAAVIRALRFALPSHHCVLITGQLLKDSAKYVGVKHV